MAASSSNRVARRRFCFGLALLGFSVFLPAGTRAAGSDEIVYLTPEQALKLAFPNPDRMEEETVKLTPAQKSRVEKKLGWRLKQDSYQVHKGFAGGKLESYAVITDEIGKYKPMTFMVTATPDFQVERVDILVYREHHGMEVHESSFLSQFKGKSTRDGFHPGRDVVNITGATLSVQAVSGGIKRILCILEEVYGQHP